jgi:hypothetical protein
MDSRTQYVSVVPGERAALYGTCGIQFQLITRAVCTPDIPVSSVRLTSMLSSRLEIWRWNKWLMVQFISWIMCITDVNRCEFLTIQMTCAEIMFSELLKHKFYFILFYPRSMNSNGTYIFHSWPLKSGILYCDTVVEYRNDGMVIPKVLWKGQFYGNGSLQW